MLPMRLFSSLASGWQLNIVVGNSWEDTKHISEHHCVHYQFMSVFFSLCPDHLAMQIKEVQNFVSIRSRLAMHQARSLQINVCLFLQNSTNMHSDMWAMYAGCSSSNCSCLLKECGQYRWSLYYIWMVWVEPLVVLYIVSINTPGGVVALLCET